MAMARKKYTAVDWSYTGMHNHPEKSGGERRAVYSLKAATEKGRFC